MAKRKRTSLKPVETQAPDPVRTHRDEMVHQVKLALGYGIVGLCVLGALLSAFGPRSLGLPSIPPAAAIGVTILALLRLAALMKELRRQGAAAE
jgi:hypothetical protein